MQPFLSQPKRISACVRACVRACTCVHVRACVRARVRALARVRVCVNKDTGGREAYSVSSDLNPQERSWRKHSQAPQSPSNLYQS